MTTGGEIHSRVIFRIGAQHYFAGTYTFGRQSAVGLQTASDIRSGTAGARTADDFVASAQGDRSAGSAGHGLGFFCDDADAGLKIEFAGIDPRVMIGDSRKAVDRRRSRHAKAHMVPIGEPDSQ